MVNNKAKHAKKQSELEKSAIRITEWVGTPVSIIVHTFLFIIAFLFYYIGVPFETILLVLTTIVSLEAIYLSLFIQLSVNVTKESIEDVEEDIGEIREDVEGIEGDFGEIQEDVEGLEGNLRKMRRNVQELEADVEDISEDIDRFTLEEDREGTGEQTAHIESSKSLQNVEREIINLSKGILGLRNDLEIPKKNLP